ncbi:MAG: hypothetical protein PVH35_06140 [Syntrophobacterales bacterium]|jgi:hypothetical protein
MTCNTRFVSPLPTQGTFVILNRAKKFLVPATIVPLDLHNSRLFSDWNLEVWELLQKLEWYRRPFVWELLRRHESSSEKTFLLLTRLVDFSQLLTECIEQRPDLTPNPLSIQIQAALTVEVPPNGSTVIYNIESAPWNKFGPDYRFFSLPAASLFFFAAEHHLATTPKEKKFILSHPTDDGIIFYQNKLELKLLWSRGPDRYAVVERDSLLQALLSYQKNLEQMKQTIPLFEPHSA